MFSVSLSGGTGLFSTSYQCFSHTFNPGKVREGIENGGKILMPPSALEHLTRLNVQYPMLFKLTNKKTKRSTHCGVLEFVAGEGRTYVPYWMLRNLLLEEGDVVHVRSVSLKVATFAKFQPQSESFLDISNPKAVLENALRDFACLTVGDMIAINYNDNTYELQVLETKPEAAVTIIECDMRVDFAPPVGYVEKQIEKKKSEATEHNGNEGLIPELAHGFQVFGGSGSRLDGRTCEPSSSVDSGCKKITQRGVPNYDYEPGSLTFLRVVSNKTQAADEKSEFKPFEGEGSQLKPKKKPPAQP